MRKLISAIVIMALTLGATAQQYDLKLNLKKGQKYTQAMVMDLNMTESISGQEINVLSKMQFEFKQQVKSITAKGDFVMESEYSRVAMTMDAMGQKMAYDSNDKDTVGGNGDFMKAFGNIIGKKFQVTLTPKGKVVEIKGLKEIIDAMGSGKDDPTTQKLLESTLDEKKLTSSFESSYHIFPDKPVKVGESWTQKSNVESMFPMDISTGYTLKDVSNGVAKISASGDFSMKKDDFESNGMKMKINFTGTYTGTYDLDLTTGISKTGNIQMPMKGTMELMGMEVPVTVSTNMQTTTTANN